MLHSFAANRARDASPPDFPAMATFGPDQHCLGLAFIRAKGGIPPDLARIRDRVRAIRRGTIGEAGHERELYVVLFQGQAGPFARDIPEALPLVSAGPGTLASFSSDHALGENTQSASVRAIEIWWAGAARRISLDLLEPVSLAYLWPMPDVTIHPATPCGFTAHAGTAPAADVRDESPEEAEIGAPTKVGRTLALAPLLAERKGDPFGDLRDTLGRRRSFGTSLRVGLGSLPNFGGMFITLLGLGLAAILLWHVANGGPILPILIVFLIARFLLGPLIGLGGLDPAASARPRGPGLFDNLLGWLAWKNPFSPLRQQLDRRVQRIQSLASQGMIDEALKLALKIGGGEARRKLPKRFPRQLPGARAQLDFEHAKADFEVPVMPEALNWQLRQSYEALAKQLEADGDFRRAAFIRSQLLGQNDAAVLLLEKSGMLEEATRLAVAAKVDPTLTIRLLYESGEKAAALALARRAGCFEQLAQQSHRKDAVFHVDVIKAWTDALLESGQPLRALQVTDDLANELGANRTLLGLRQQWTAAALQRTEPAGFAAEPVARALLSTGLADTGQLDDFPRSAPHTGDALGNHALQILREQCLHGENGEELLALLAALDRLAAPDSGEQEQFWQQSAPALLDVLTSALLRHASRRMQPHDFDALQKLLDRAEHPVLARDLGKLRKLYRASAPPPRDWPVPPPIASSAPALAGCVLGTGLLVVWRESELLELLDRSGVVLWRERVSDVIALVPVGSGGNVLLLQAQHDGLVHLTRFDTTARKLHAIGRLELLAHHDVTTEFAWLVQVGGEIGALDLARLCAPQPEFQFLWSCALTDRLRAAAFLHDGTSASWITIDVSADRVGVTEMWRLKGSGELQTFLLEAPESDSEGKPLFPIGWAWSQSGAQRTYEPLLPVGAHLMSSEWSEDAEERARKKARQRAMFDGFDYFVPCDFGRSVMIPPDLRTAVPEAEARRTIVRSQGEHGPAFTLRHEEDLSLRCLARMPARPDDPLPTKPKGRRSRTGNVLLADQHGRLFLVDPELARVTVL